MTTLSASNNGHSIDGAERVELLQRGLASYNSYVEDAHARRAPDDPDGAMVYDITSAVIWPDGTGEIEIVRRGHMERYRFDLEYRPLTKSAPACVVRHVLRACSDPGESLPVLLTPALARRVAEESEKLSAMPEHGGQDWRPVVVVAWSGRKRPVVCTHYDRRPIGTILATDPETAFGGYDMAQIVAAKS